MEKDNPTLEPIAEPHHQAEPTLFLDEGEDPATFHKVLSHLKSKAVEFKHYSHKPVKTSAEAAAERGIALDSGAKALLVKYSTKEAPNKELFALLVMSGVRKVSWKEVKTFLNSKNVSFASVEEVKKIAGCIPGAVPPLGSLFGIQTIVDPSLEKQGEQINFNCGLRSQTVSMKTADYLKIETPTLFTFTTV